MTLEKQVMWIEGAFLRQQHFQRQDLRTESLVRFLSGALQPFDWGFVSLELTGLKSGQIGIKECSGIFPDGLPFAFPGNVGEIFPEELDKGVRDEPVYLAIPAIAEGAALAERRRRDGMVGRARLTIEEIEARDQLAPGAKDDSGARREPIEVGLPSLRLVVGERPRYGFSTLKVAHIVEMSNNEVILDREFVPSILSVSVMDGLQPQMTLSRDLHEIVSLFDSRADHYASYLQAATSSNTPAEDHFQLLKVCNRWAARLLHLTRRQRYRDEAPTDHISGRALLHPSDLHADLVEAAADLAAFTRPETFRPPSFPMYDHDNLGKVFQPVLAELRRALTHLTVEKTIEIPLSKNEKWNLWFNQEIAPELLGDSHLVLMVTSDLEGGQLRDQLPSRANVGALKDLKAIMASAVRSVPLVQLDRFPDGLRPIPGWTPFEFDTKHEDWKGVLSERTLAIQVQDLFPGLKMRLWAIRR